MISEHATPHITPGGENLIDNAGRYVPLAAKNGEKKIMKTYAVAGLLAALSACVNYIPADPTNPPIASAWSDSHSCQRSDQNYASGVAVASAMPVAGVLFGLADLPGYERRLDECMKAHGWRAAD